MQATYADILRPARPVSAPAYDAAAVVAGSVFVGLMAQVAFFLPFTIVPVTMQTFAVLLVGALLGSRRGAAALALYLAEGLAGLPVFAHGGFGPMHFAGPTGGYLIGFVAAAWLTGRLAECGWDRRVGTTLAAMTLGTAVIFASGLAWLIPWIAAAEGSGLPRAFPLALTTGLLPFLPGAAVKVALAAGVLPMGWRLLRRLTIRR